jgi:hypothetical protein
MVKQAPAPLTRAAGACVCVLGLVVRGTLRGLPLAVGHDPGG